MKSGGFEEGCGIDISEWFVQMLKKKKKKKKKHREKLTNTNNVYNLQLPMLYQNLIRSLLGTNSFIQKFNFHIK